MAQIKQIGPGRKTTGTIDGVTYVTRNGQTYVRSTPTMPASAYNTPAAKIRQAVFKMIQMHLKLHLRTIKQTFTPKGNGSPTNRYYSTNGKALSLALQTLAEQYVDGEDVTIDDVEAAISAYAAEHPKSIKIASKSGYADVYLTGPWPATITLNALTGDSTVIIIVSENGVTTTYNPDGSTVVVQGSSSSSGSSGSSSTGSGQSGTTGGGSGTGGSTGGGNTTPGNPRLTISRTGTGSSSVTAGGNAVSSSAEVAAGTQVSISVNPAAGATPTATLNGTAITLTENGGVYTGTFTMPSANATLVIYSGGNSGGSDGEEEGA